MFGGWQNDISTLLTAECYRNRRVIISSGGIELPERTQLSKGQTEHSMLSSVLMSFDRLFSSMDFVCVYHAFVLPLGLSR